MLEFLSQYWGSILVALILLALCGLAVWRLYAARKTGKCCGGCGGCGCCPNSGACHKPNNKK